MRHQILVAILSVLLFAAIGVIVWQNYSEDQNNTSPTQGVVEENPGIVEGEFSAPQVSRDKTVSSNNLIVGEWQSLSDPQSVIAFYANGEVEDIYGGGAVSESGTYYIFESPSALPSEVAESLPGLESDAAYLRQTFGSADYYYAIIGLDTDSLSLIYLARGNTLEYRRLTTE